MSSRLTISRLTLFQPRIPMRQKFRHATAERCVSEPLIVAIELADGTTGFGETHPREYVTGETMNSAINAIRKTFLPLLVETRPGNFGEAIEAAAGLPLADEAGNCITAARAAIELAMLDAYSRAYGRSIESIAGWVAEQWLGPPGSRDTCRFSGVISSGRPARAARAVRMMRLGGLRQFKLKVGDADDDARVNAVIAALGSSVSRGKTSLRLDANGAWSLKEATERLTRWEALPIASVEQPLPKGDIEDWVTLASETNLPLMADESLVTPEDAQSLIAYGAASWFNIRISKNGGLIPALRLALIAHESNVDLQLGCMVGETSILSAAGRVFLQLVPDVEFAEGSFGKFLLEKDVVKRPLRFGFGGRWQTIKGPGLGVEVIWEQIADLCDESPEAIPL